MPVKNPDLLAQIHLSGEVSCQEFTPHMLKANLCTSCSKLLSKHSPQAIPDDQCLLKALEFTQKGEKTPSCILPRTESTGGLYHGGFKGVMNADFLREQGLTHIVNTAKGFMFNSKYKEAVDFAKNELGIKFLELGWEDSIAFSIPEAELVQAVEFIHSARLAGASVLVHCAQGKSRSATAVVAYMMACCDGKGVGFEEGLRRVQEQRKMAEPNPTFVKCLKAFEKSESLSHLRKELKTNL